MTSAERLAGLCIIALALFYGAHLGETKKNSRKVHKEPDVPFPPARPSTHNLAAICHQGRGRPRYPPSFFPKSGSSHFRRRGHAMNRLESWFRVCCSGHLDEQSSQILCCAQQAWKKALSQFCVEEYSTMTLPYECCENTGEARWSCFDSELPNPNYTSTPGYDAPEIPEEPGFTFDPNTC
ncbi:claudin [Sarotherodon galilaeus]